MVSLIVAGATSLITLADRIHPVAGTVVFWALCLAAGFLALDIAPAFAGSYDWRIIQRFRSPEALEAWRTSVLRSVRYSYTHWWSDLPILLAAAAIEGTAFVPDAAGRGTTLVAARRWAAFLPEYGNHSRRRHLDAGFTELALPDLDGLRLDVDTVADLQALQRLQPGPRTRAVLARMAEETRPLE